MPLSPTALKRAQEKAAVAFNNAAKKGADCLDARDRALIQAYLRKGAG